MEPITENAGTPAYTIDSNRIFSERFEGDTIIIDLQTGVYYALNLSGSVIWESLSRGLTLNQIEDLMVNRCQGSLTFRQTILADIRSFIDSLLSNSLITEVSSGAGNRSIDFDFQLSADSYSPPALVLHDDIKDVLMADIVHSIGSDGWPEFKG